MYSSTSNSGLLQSAERSGSSGGSNILVQRRSERQAVSLISLASEEDDEVQFDSKQLPFLYFFVVRNRTSNLLINTELAGIKILALVT